MSCPFLLLAVYSFPMVIQHSHGPAAVLAEWTSYFLIQVFFPEMVNERCPVLWGLVTSGGASEVYGPTFHCLPPVDDPSDAEIGFNRETWRGAVFKFLTVWDVYLDLDDLQAQGLPS